MLDRFAVDDGHHLPQLVIDEDASSAAGTARFRAGCSCGRMAPHPAGTREQALTAHLAHVNTKLGPSKGPKWLPVGARIIILMLAMLAIWMGCYITGEMLADGSKLIVAGSILIGAALAFGLMVAMRRYIAPTRA
ncbi:hypothetical protein [Streptomyces sp. CBG9]|uniref:hypothetical protein n=1 Tax=Streptomyces sp. CBG9 TaxID=2762622 RepID=UPI0016496DE5|nr:hypothetical protein [Streptomyces sp. CBG9]